jgi:hypothetical protein
MDHYDFVWHGTCARHRLPVLWVTTGGNVPVRNEVMRLLVHNHEPGREGKLIALRHRDNRQRPKRRFLNRDLRCAQYGLALWSTSS